MRVTDRVSAARKGPTDVRRRRRASQLMLPPRAHLGTCLIAQRQPASLPVSPATRPALPHSNPAYLASSMQHKYMLGGRGAPRSPRSPWSPMRITSIATQIRVANLERALQFYLDTLGFEE